MITRWGILKWMCCCLAFRFYGVMPLSWQARLFNEVTGPFWYYLNIAIEARPELKQAIAALNKEGEL